MCAYSSGLNGINVGQCFFVEGINVGQCFCAFAYGCEPNAPASVGYAFGYVRTYVLGQLWQARAHFTTV